MVRMTKHSTVMSVQETQSSFLGGDTVLFHNVEDEDERVEREAFKLTRQNWEDMGCPTHITLTVEPGDTLNEPS